MTSADWAAWVEAAGTWAAVAAAAVAGFYAKKAADRAKEAVSHTADQLDLERARDQVRADARRREQADLVSAWIGVGGEGWNACHVRNQSALPVFDVEVAVQTSPQVLWSPKIPALIAPRDPVVTRLTDDENSSLTQAGLDPTSTPAAITFRDAAGSCWTRRQDGRLVEGHRKYVDR